jgi:hypothetical protein
VFCEFLVFARPSKIPRGTPRQFLVADSAALALALLPPPLFLRNIKLRHPSLVLPAPFDRFGFDAKGAAEGLTEPALGLFGGVVFFGDDPTEVAAAFGQFLE